MVGGLQQEAGEKNVVNVEEGGKLQHTRTSILDLAAISQISQVGREKDKIEDGTEIALQGPKDTHQFSLTHFLQ